MTSRFRSLGVLGLLSALLLFPNLAHGQFRGGIQGTVTDPSGAAVPGATVVTTNEETGVAQETVSGDGGFYRISGLPPGRYRVAVSLTGFKEAVTEHVTVTAEELRGDGAPHRKRGNRGHVVDPRDSESAAGWPRSV
jgi:carboxypeptidase family protein